MIHTRTSVGQLCGLPVRIVMCAQAGIELLEVFSET